MSWICVVGMNVVVGLWKKYDELVEVWIPSPRSTRRDSSVGARGLDFRVKIERWIEVEVMKRFVG